MTSNSERWQRYYTKLKQAAVMLNRPVDSIRLGAPENKCECSACERKRRISRNWNRKHRGIAPERVLDGPACESCQCEACIRRRAERNRLYRGKPVQKAQSWEREFFHLAGSWLACRNAALDYPDPLPDGSTYCPYGLMVGELAVQSEMHLVLREAGMLPAQRLARCAGRLLNAERRTSGRASGEIVPCEG